MRLQSPVESVVRPGYVHPPGTEAEVIASRPGGPHMVTLTVRKEDGEVDWTETFQLPKEMRVDPSKPRVILPKQDEQPRAKMKLLMKNGHLSGVEVEAPDGTVSMYGIDDVVVEKE